MDIVVHSSTKSSTAHAWLRRSDRDVYFSSKVTTVRVSTRCCITRRHPAEKLSACAASVASTGTDVGVTGIEANSGSLGWDLERSRIAWAKSFLADGRVVVRTGDGELQEGQNFEACKRPRSGDPRSLGIVIATAPVRQTDEEILRSADLESKLQAFGWHVASCDATTTAAAPCLRRLPPRRGTAQKALIAHTIKGKGVSFMEHPLPCAQWRNVPLARRRSLRRRLCRAHAELVERVRKLRTSSSCRCTSSRRSEYSLEGEPNQRPGLGRR